ncbi:MAG: serine/threonine protein kinase [Bryobacterales bacterium]|nr:serine/threonine protein kinase [Bryobacterales bacterium]
MTANRWRQVEELFHRAASLPLAERDHWLDKTCTGDEELARQVRLLLHADASDGGTIERQIDGSVDAWLGHPAAAQPACAGPWRIVKPLAAGGMGEVYLAARGDDSYRQLAAVKILRAEHLAPGMVERFRQERQILAELDHPNIARLLDGGATADGRPYFVIEYVDGVPLTRHAATLPLRERCALFTSVCDAVAYAHRNLIVHRDLKPANILVDTNGAPKLLDFGIAKLIGVDHSMTSSMHAMFTPDYASPEQILGQPITTATDVYALGAVLFELLAGRPVRSGAVRSFAELVHDVTGGSPVTPSRVAAERIPVDLDRIVEKALALEPERRYGSADQLAADLRRFLAGHAVEARGNSWFYSASKFARRHWVPLSAAVLLVAGLAASAVWSFQQAQLASNARLQAEHERDRTQHERARAELALAESLRQKALAEKHAAEATLQRASAQQRFERARRLTHKFLFEIDDSLKDTVGATKARHVLVATALEHLDQMGREIGDDQALIRDLARAYARVGDLQGNAGSANLGDTSASISSYRKSLEWRRKLRQDAKDILAAADTTVKLAKSLKWVGRMDEAEDAFARAAVLYSQWKPLLPPGREFVAVVSRSNLLRTWSEHLQVLGRHEKVRELLTASIADLQRLPFSESGNVSVQRGIYLDSFVLGRSLIELDDWQEAHRVAELAVTVTRNLVGPTPPAGEKTRLIQPTLLLIEVLRRAPPPIADIPRALSINRDVLAIADSVARLDPDNVRNQSLLADVLSSYGELLRAANQLPQATAALERAVAIAGKLLSASPSNGFYQDLLGTTLILIGQLHLERQDRSAALRDLRRGAAMLENSVAAGRVANSATLRTARQSLAALERP